MNDIYAQKILILDFGSQYSQIIARRVREVGVYCEMHSYAMSDADIKAFAPTGIILSGGPESVREETTPRIPEAVFDMGCPVLGICYGMQAMALQLGGKVDAGTKREFGYAQVALQNTSVLLENIYDEMIDGAPVLDVWMSHGDHVSELPENFIVIGHTLTCSIAAMADETRRLYGLQFHPEVAHTKQGYQILERFIKDICHCEVNWTPNNIIEEQVAHIRQQVGKDKVLLGLSGGVDSSVAALLLHQAIGDQLTCVFVDNGLLRLNEADEVKRIFTNNFGLKLICVDARKQFYDALKGIDEPEAKRKIIGKQFIDVFDAEASKLQDVKWLAQGTIYSDVIESAASKNGTAHVIKSHHNVGGLPAEMAFKLIEPLRELFKDEVRKVGLTLGLPYDLLNRHPFPGPGLGVRILGEVKEAYADTLRLADAILIDELHKADLYYKVSQAFVVFLPVKSVGVVGDARQYEHVVAIRIVETADFMTAHWARMPYEFLDKVSSRIINEVKGISRVTYDISSKPPATIEWE